MRICLCVIIFVSCSSLIGCAPSPEEKAILDYEQVVDGVKTDLSMGIQSIEKTGVITGTDSLKPLNDSLNSLAFDRMQVLFKEIDHYLNLTSEQNLITITATSKARVQQAQRSIKMYRTITNAYTAELKRYERKHYDSTELHKIYSKLKAYESKPDSVLASRYRCTYTINNPAMNFAKQEITKTYHIRDNKVVYAGK